MKKRILVVLIFAAMVFPTAAGAVSIKQLSRDIASCLCNGQGAAFTNGCRIYMSLRLQLLNTPDEAVKNARKVCGDTHASDNTIEKCKQGIAFLRNKE